MAMAENIGIEIDVRASAATPRVELRRATEADCQLLWEWCNDPMVRAHSFESEPITFAEHRRWLGRKVVDPRCALLIAASGDGMPIGQIRYDLTDDEAVVSVSVDESARGRGHGTELIRLSAEKIFADTSVKIIHAFIKPGNQVSLRAFERCGYRTIGRLAVHEQPALHLVLERDR